jgi:hypothetical protein
MGGFDAAFATCRRARLRLRLGLPLDAFPGGGDSNSGDDGAEGASAAPAQDSEGRQRKTGGCAAHAECASGRCLGGKCCTAKGGLGAACRACGSNGGCVRCANGFRQPRGVFHCGEDDDAAVEGWVAWLQQSSADYHRAGRALPEALLPLLAARDSTPDAVAAAAERLGRACGADAASLPALRAWLAPLAARLIGAAEAAAAAGRSGDGGDGGKRWAERWAAQVRAAAPHYVLRTTFAREVTGRVQEGMAAGTGAGAADARAVLSAAARRLQQPFEPRAWRLDAADASGAAAFEQAEQGAQGGGDGGGKGAAAAGKRQQCAAPDCGEIVAWLGAGFSALSPRRRLDPQETQTSCGGQ